MEEMELFVVVEVEVADMADLGLVEMVVEE